MSMTATCVLDATATLGEGPLWDPRRDHLWWVDIVAGELHAYDPVADRDTVLNVGEMIGAVGLHKDGGLVAALEHGFATIDPNTGRVEPLHDPEPDRPENRFNDGACGPRGRFWAGTMARDGTPEQGSLYCLDPDGSVERKVSNVTISNGLAWDASKGRMYYVDTPTQSVSAFDYAPDTGTISNRRIAVHIPEAQGAPDGLTVDADGMLWVAHWGGACVGRWNPETGERSATVEVPATQVSSCAFGGAGGRSRSALHHDGSGGAVRRRPGRTASRRGPLPGGAGRSGGTCLRLRRVERRRYNEMGAPCSAEA
jgi:sugar lactone lactonase YvrE